MTKVTHRETKIKQINKQINIQLCWKKVDSNFNYYKVTLCSAQVILLCLKGLIVQC